MTDSQVRVSTSQMSVMRLAGRRCDNLVLVCMKTPTMFVLRLQYKRDPHRRPRAKAYITQNGHDCGVHAKTKPVSSLWKVIELEGASSCWNSIGELPIRSRIDIVLIDCLLHREMA